MMTKPELVAALADRAGITKAHAGRMLDTIRDLAGDTLSAGKEFAIPGVIRLQPVQRKGRKGRHPGTGEAVEVPPRRGIRPRVPADLARRAAGEA